MKCEELTRLVRVLEAEGYEVVGFREREHSVLVGQRCEGKESCEQPRRLCVNLLLPAGGPG